MLDIALLGTGGMIPLPDRFLAAILARLNGRMLLIDCGESTQVSMRLLGWGLMPWRSLSHPCPCPHTNPYRAYNDMR